LPTAHEQAGENPHARQRLVPSCGWLEPPLGHLETKLLDPVPHLIAMEAEQYSSLALISAGPCECLHHELSLQLLQVHTIGWKAKG